MAEKIQPRDDSMFYRNVNSNNEPTEEIIHEKADTLTPSERKMIAKMRRDHEEYGCPSDPYRAQYCAKDPCRTLTIVNLIERLAPEANARR